MTPSSPQPHTSRSPRLLALTAAVLAATGLALLTMPHPPSAPALADAATAPATSPEHSSGPAVSQHFSGGAPSAAHSARATASAPSPSAPASMLPPRGEGAAGDRAIQQALETAWPADLRAGDERWLLAAGPALLRADVTGVGRGRWPEVFPGSGRGLAPAFSAARFRVQAAIARRDGRPDRAVVHLVWAGTDRGGAHSDGRITDLYFTRTSQEGVPVWVPQPRT